MKWVWSEWPGDHWQGWRAYLQTNESVAHKECENGKYSRRMRGA